MKKWGYVVLLGAVVLAALRISSVSASAPVAIIVDKHSFSQSGSLASTILFTPVVDGDYRITLITSNLNSGFDPHLTWTDDSGARTVVLNINQQNTAYNGFIVYSLHAIAGNAISVSCGCSGQAYVMSITTEQL